MQPGMIDAEDGVYNLVPGEWRNQPNITALGPTNARNYKKNVKENLEKLCKFFSSEVVSDGVIFSPNMLL